MAYQRDLDHFIIIALHLVCIGLGVFLPIPFWLSAFLCIIASFGLGYRLAVDQTQPRFAPPELPAQFPPVAKS